MEIKKTTDHAIVGVVTAVLLIGVIVAVISLVQSVYVPKIMEQREADHMDKVAEQFAHLTSVIHGQAADKTPGIPIATSITLGSKELPYLLSVRSYGALEILEDATAIMVNNRTASGGIKTSQFKINCISYSSSNAYFLDQTYIYEAGAMIVGQTNGNLMMIHPAFFVDLDNQNKTVTLSFNMVKISSVGQKTIAAGYGTYPVQTEFHEISVNKTFIDVSQIILATSYTNAWSMFLNSSLTQAGLNLDGYGSDFSLFDSGETLKLEFDTDLDVKFFFKIIDIKTQIGPGWIE